MAPPKVLIVDDDAALVRSIVQTLQARAFETTACGSVELARQHLQRHPFDLIILDLVLDGGHGRALMRTISEGRLPRIPMIVVSGAADMADAIEALRFRVSDFVRKPFWPEELLAAVDRALPPLPELKGETEGRAPREAEGGAGEGPSEEGFDLSEAIEAKAEALAQTAKLTHREREVLHLLLLGRNAEEIGIALDIRPRTAKFHQTNVLRKLGADSRFDLLRVLM